MPINFSPKAAPSAPQAQGSPGTAHPVTTIQAHTQPGPSKGQAIVERLERARQASKEPAPGSHDSRQAIPQNTTNVEKQETAAEAPSQPLSPQYAALARKEAALRKAQQELKQAQETWKTREAEYIPKSRFQEDPLKALAEAGLSYDRIVETQLNQAGSAPDEAQAKIAELEGRLAKYESNLQERDQSAYQQALKQIRNDTELLVSSDPAYETIKATSSVDSVVDLIEQVFRSEGVVLTVEEAAKEVEDLLVEKSSEQVRTLSQLSKIKARLEQPKTEATQVAPTEPQTPQSAARPTLTNNLTSTKPLSARERAILAFEGRLGK